MDGKSIHLTFFVPALVLFGSVCPGQESQIVNGEFDAGLDSWHISEGDGFAVDVVNTAELPGPNCLKVDVFDAAAHETVVLSQSGLALTGGATYQLSFTAKAQDFRQIGVIVEEEDDDGRAYAWYELVDLKPAPQTFAFEFICGRVDSESATLSFVVSHPQYPLAGEDENIDVYVDAVSFIQEPPADPNLAHYPLPPDDTFREATWVALSWTPGSHAASHDFYFGQDFDDVNTGSGGTYWWRDPSTMIMMGFPDIPSPDGLIPGTT